MESSKRLSGTKRKAEPTPPWHCGVCNVSAPCEAALHAHLIGKKHKAKESNLREENKVTKKKFWCDLCDVDCNSSGLLRSRCNGKKHKAKESLVKDRASGEGEAEVEMEIEDEEFYCETCDVWCNGKVLMESHLNGKKHKAKEAKKEEFCDDQRGKKWKKDLWCEICRVECNSKAMMEKHLNGKKHKVKEEKVRIYIENEEEKEEKIEEEVRDCEGKDEDGDGQQCKISIEKVVKDTDYNGIEKNGLCSCTDEAVIAKEDKYCGKEITAQEEEEKMEEDRNVAESSNPQGQIRNTEATTQAEENRNDFNLQSKQNMFEEMRELWCLICKVKCDSRAMMNKHLKGMEHKANEALRRGKPIYEMEEVKIAMKE